MATEVHQFTVTIPAGTTKAATFSENLSLDNRVIESIDLEVPAGPAGLMGFYIARAGQQVIPFEDGQYIVWDDRSASWQLSEQPTAQGWQIVGYNTGVFDHAVVVRFHTNYPDIVSTALPELTIVSTAPVGVNAGVVL